MPARIAALPMSERGYPVPNFVKWIDGKPEFRLVDNQKIIDSIKLSLCHVCGQKLGKYRCYVVGPMCVVNRNTAEPPCHLDCAEWSVQACPFILNPKMERRENNLPATIQAPAGIAIRDNPGIMAIYLCQKYIVEIHDDGVLFKLGDPMGVSWWKEGRSATRAEVEQVLKDRLPLIEAVCEDDEDRAALASYAERARRWLPIS